MIKDKTVFGFLTSLFNAVKRIAASFNRVYKTELNCNVLINSTIDGNTEEAKRFMVQKKKLKQTMSWYSEMKSLHITQDLLRSVLYGKWCNTFGNERELTFKHDSVFRSTGIYSSENGKSVHRFP